jgi:hypothetical protein
LRRFFVEGEAFDWTMQETLKIEKIPVRETYYYIYVAEKNREIELD